MDTVSQMELFRAAVRNGSVAVLAGPESGTHSSLVLDETYGPRGHVPTHYHDCEEVLVVLEGEGMLFQGQDPRTIVAGTTVVIPSGKAHCLYNTGIGSLHLLVFHPQANPLYQWVPGLFTDETNGNQSLEELLAQAI